MSTIKFGPAGIGATSDAISNLKKFHRLGLKAAEISFTYGPYIKDKKDAIKIGETARELGIILSIHAPYYINLNSKETKKIEASKERILKCCEVGNWLGAKRIIFHAGFYSGMSSSEASIKIKESIIEMQKAIKKNKWDIELCPEVMGKINVFGSIDDIADLVDSTGCGMCIDLAHILARYGEYKFDKIEKVFKMKKWHVHFSGIEYGEKGEKRHILTPAAEWKKILKFLKKIDKDVILICESPDPVGDSVVGKGIWEKL